MYPNLSISSIAAFMDSRTNVDSSQPRGRMPDYFPTMRGNVEYLLRSSTRRSTTMEDVIKYFIYFTRFLAEEWPWLLLIGLMLLFRWFGGVTSALPGSRGASRKPLYD